MNNSSDCLIFMNLRSTVASIVSHENNGVSFILQLLQKEASKCLGSGPLSNEEIKCHKWFSSVNWKNLDVQKIRPSFLPEVAGKHCVSNFYNRWTNVSVFNSPAGSPKYSEILFKGFTYVRPPAPFLQRNDSFS
ncbi:protein-serine kinase 1 [Actinidia rufa]|uniref:Protein-serine kinase 1 n=1 Tax=Actinidia rufa TaxID=165716 RepID=A0A7J0GWB2_9ERIC|nr:protein-serine kinase 1 [Actinidia rufa]